MTKSKSAYAEDNKRRQAEFRKRNKADGLKRFTAWVRPEIEGEVKAYVKRQMDLWKKANGPTET